MKCEPDQAYLLRQEALSLSGPALLELLQGSLARQASFRFRARGSSMLPFIQDGDSIWIEPLEGRALYMGDVLAFIYPAHGRLVVHRILGFAGDNCLMGGDNLSGRRDGCIPYSSLIGRVSGVERGGRPVRLGLGPERGLIALLSCFGWLAPLARLGGRARGLLRAHRMAPSD